MYYLFPFLLPLFKESELSTVPLKTASATFHSLISMKQNPIWLLSLMQGTKSEWDSISCLMNGMLKTLSAVGNADNPDSYSKGIEGCVPSFYALIAKKLLLRFIIFLSYYSILCYFTYYIFAKTQRLTF